MRLGILGIALLVSFSADAAETIRGEWIVKLKKPGLTLSLKSLSTSVVPLAGAPEFALVKTSSQKARTLLESDPAVEYVQPNYVYRAIGASEPNDSDFVKLWGLNNTGQADSSGQTGKAGADINVLPLWAQGHTGRKDVLVAVIDTGINWDHPDLKDNLFTNSGEIAGNGVDDDKNGFVDDVHGWNFHANNANSNDDHSHGSHCAGTIGGTGNNGLGIAGVVWNVSLLPVKFLGADGSGSTAGAIGAVRYATLMGAKVLSNSWGGGSYDRALEEAIEASHAAGAVFVAAAGNSSLNNDQSATYPANYPVPNVISVAATDNRDALASFSNFGKRKVHVAAPGVRVWSSVLGSEYKSYSGTSMATPHVAGAAALMLSINSAWSAEEIKDRLIRSSDPVPALARKVLSGGRMNLANAVAGVFPPKPGPDESLWRDEAYSAESPHPYTANQTYNFSVSAPGAQYVRVIFERVDTEAKYDPIDVIDAQGQVVDSVSGKEADYVTEYVQGDALTLRFKTDASVNGWGFKVSKIQVIR
jgi:subtilisin family serine protease